MRETTQIQVNKTVTSKVKCDQCGKTHNQLWRGFNQPYIHEIDIFPGYGSKFDMMKISIDLCDDCLTDILAVLGIEKLEKLGSDKYEQSR